MDQIVFLAQVIVEKEMAQWNSMVSKASIEICMQCSVSVVIHGLFKNESIVPMLYN